MMSALFEIENLRVALPDFTRKPLFGPAPRNEILKGLSFAIAKGEAIGIVGESGSGKTTLGRTLVRLLEPSAGSIKFDGADISHLDELALAPYRRHLQVIFQNPLSSLNPRRTAQQIIAAPLKLHGVAKGRQELADHAANALKMVGLSPDLGGRYPQELSGGQRQRVGIARAIALKPSFVLADEIVSGLDMSSQAQILDLLARLKEEMKLTLAFISHDLSVVRRLCERAMVMRQGEIVELRPCADMFAAPEHPYTRQLLAAIPLPEIDTHWLSQA
ncbi:MAG: ABC transporter ATP-binding protein [Rhizobiales bacterium]|nr:ABC transporter ATP-binding protein [Hyphomicrobiales bacterium]